MRFKSLLAAAGCTAAAAGATASAAFAGEITGPPGTPGIEGSALGGPTKAPANANSFCAFSGLNDMNPEQGPIDRRTQTPKDFAPGDAGHGNEFFPMGCKGGSNLARDK
jgi:hypothetical protein